MAWLTVRESALKQPGDSEVDDDRYAGWPHENVVGLNVPVDDALVPEQPEPANEVGDKPERGGGRREVAHAVRERSRVDVFLGDDEPVACGRLEVVLPRVVR